MRHPAVSTRPADHPATTSARHWRRGAACLGEPLDLFFPTAAAGPQYAAQVAAAKAVCRRCPVVTACLADALAHAPFGIAGGLTEQERSAVRTTHQGGKATDTDAVMVTRLVHAGRQPGATRDELIAAAVQLIRSGQPVVQAAAWLGLAPRTVTGYTTAARGSRVAS